MKIIIEISDTPLGKTEVKCSTPWAELSAKHGKGELAPGAEKLSWVAVTAIQRFIVAESKRLFSKPMKGTH